MGSRFWKLLGVYDSETTAWTEFATSGFASPFAPGFNARLLGLRVTPNRSAATSLINMVQFRLTSDSFRPNAIECGGVGSGLQTAPALQAEHLDWEVNQEITKGSDVVLEGRNVTADTPVTVSVGLWGYFEI